ncbi:MAG: YgjV family protein [Bacilli bacterium]|nr:YgjV family protein [Bacilli bacterium]
MTTQVIIAQVFSVISWCLLLYSYYKEDVKDLIRIQILVSLMDILCYIFLGAISGIIVATFELIQGIAFYKTDKAKNIFLLTIPIYIVYALFTYHTPVALLPVLATFIDNLSLTRGKTFATIGGILAQTSWAVYDFSVYSYVGALTDIIIVISNLSILILGYSYIKRVNKLNVNRCSYLSNNINNVLHQIDKTNYQEDLLYEPHHNKELFNKNKDSLLLINYKNKIIGYVSYYVISKEEVDKIINKHKYDINYSIDNIINFKKNSKNYLIINNISLNKNYQNKDSIDLIIDNIKRYLKRKYYQGYKIEQIISPAINSFEKRVLEVSGFTKYKDYSNDTTLYTMSREELENIFLGTGKYKLLDEDEITDNVFDEILKLDKRNLTKEDLWDTSYQKEVFNKNKDSFIIITRNNKVVAYLNYLSITKNTYNNINEKPIDLKTREIKGYTRYDYNYINIESIVIGKKYRNNEINNMLINTFINRIRVLDKEDYFIRGINARPNTNTCRRIVRKIGLSRRKNNLYVLEDNKLYEKLK